jgi:protease IV
VIAANGDIARANLSAGLVDKVGGRQAFGDRVAALAGRDPKARPGGFATIRYDAWVRANPLPTAGDAIGVLTVAGDMIDGEAPAGTAGAETIVRALHEGLATKNLKGLVIRVDTPGGSTLSAERISTAIEEAKRRGLPTAVSMGGVAASAGYWISTPADRIFAEPNTITGSIGIFAILPTFERALGKIGLSADGVQTSPLTGQPDVLRGTNAVLDAVLQSTVENGYRRFIGRVAVARRMTPARVDAIGQGRVWDGGTARQLGLVDQFGSQADAVAWVARRAGLDPASVHAEYLERKPSWAAELAQSLGETEDPEAGGDAVARIAAAQRGLAIRAIGDVRRLLRGGSVQARCLECAGLGAGAAPAEDARLLDLLLARAGW